MGTKRNGLLALLGMGALAYWKYRNMTPDEQNRVKGQVNKAKENLMSATDDLKGTLDSKFSEVKETVENKYGEVKSQAEDKLGEIKKDMNDASSSPSMN